MQQVWGGGNKAFLLTNISNFYIVDGSSRKKITSSDSFTMGTTDIYSDTTSSNPIQYNTIVCNDEITNYLSQLTGAQNYFIVYAIKDNQIQINDITSKININGATTSYGNINLSLNVFNALDLRGGGRAIYASDPNLSLNKDTNGKYIIQIPSPDGIYDTVVIDEKGLAGVNGTEDNSNTLRNNYKIILNNGGYLVNKFQLVRMGIRLILNGGTFVCDTQGIYFKNERGDDLTDYSNVKYIVNNNVQIGISLDYKLGEVYNYGQIIQDGNIEITGKLWNNGIWRVKNKTLTLHGEMTNIGIFKINSNIYTYSRLNNDEGGIIEMLSDGKIIFDNEDSTLNIQHLILNRGQFIDMKNNSTIEILKTPNSLLWFIENYSTAKLDCIIKSSIPLISYNLKDSILYLENDFESDDNFKIKNNSVVISYKKTDPIFVEDDIDYERYLNIYNMKYYKDDKPINLDESLQNINDCIFELNSVNIEPDVLNTVTFLLSSQYNIKHQTDGKIDEILRLIKFGLLKDLPYTPNIPIQPVKPPFYPPKPKYQSGCPCYK